MGSGKFVKVDGVWRSVVAEFVKVGGVWRAVTENWVKIGGTWKAISVGERLVFVAEDTSDRLYSVDQALDVRTGWPLYDAGITGPWCVAVQGNGTTFWGCGTKVVKATRDGTWSTFYSGHAAKIYAIAVDSDGIVYTADGSGVYKAINPDGTLKWTKTCTIAGSIAALAVDKSRGYGYFGIQAAESSRLYRFILSNGNTSAVSGITFQDDITAIAVDHSTGNVFVADRVQYPTHLGPWYGRIQGIQWDPFCLLWPTEYAWRYSTDCDIPFMVVHRNGYLYAALGSAGKWIQFDTTTGSVTLEKGPGSSVRLEGIALDLGTNVYVSCRKADGTPSVTNVVRKYNADGLEIDSWQPYLNAQLYWVAVAPGIKAAGF